VINTLSKFPPVQMSVNRQDTADLSKISTNTIAIYREVIANQNVCDLFNYSNILFDDII
jgi:hypothetical protein